VPLTEREKQILEEIERNLHSEDPGLARDIRQPWWQKVRQVKWGAALFAVGLVTLFLGFLLSAWFVVLGVAAFAMMVLGIVLMSAATSDIARDQIRMHKVTMSDRVSGPARAKLAAWEEKVRDRYKKRP
jgi:Protein of unknown function (DUF3040)